jgi:putative Holliday junction resolvase
MRTGCRLAVDVGSVRVGVARSDPSGALAVPVETVRRGAGDLDRIAGLAAEHEALEILVGLPVTLAGAEGPAAEAARSFAELLAVAVRPIPVRLVDERLSTSAAARALQAAGITQTRGRTRTRDVVDQAAAVIILLGALDSERATGSPPGRAVEVE